MSLSELSAVALIGTERQGVSKPQNGAVAALAAQLNPEKRERELLSLAAIYGLQALAGYRLANSSSAPLSEDSSNGNGSERPIVPTKAALYLQGLFERNEPQWVLAWLRQAQQLGYRLTAEHSSKLLVLASKYPDLRPLCSPALLGQRGVWLAQCNPAWKWALKTNALSEAEAQGSAQDPNIFELGNIEERLAWLRAERQRDPVAARERLRLGWAKESGDDRVKLIAVLSERLSLEDEPFLEQCLSDRKQDVREQVMKFLRRLPTSGFVTRHFMRLQQYLHFDNNTIEINLPESYDKAWKRDGIEEKAYGVGEKSWWLKQMLGYVAPELWSQHWKIKPKTLLDIAFKHDFKDVLIRGWSQAMAGSNDQAWLYTVLDDCIIELSHQEESIPLWIQSLFLALQPTVQEQLLLDLFAKTPARIAEFEKHGILAQLSRLVKHGKHGQWSLPLSQVVLDHLQQHFAPIRGGKYWYNALNTIAHGIHQATVKQATLLYSSHDVSDSYYGGHFLHVVQERQAIAECFQ
jgi:hypothetical protein